MATPRRSLLFRAGLLVLAVLALLAASVASTRGALEELSRAAEGPPPSLAAVYRYLADPQDEVKQEDGSILRVPVLGDRKEALVNSYEELAIKKVGEVLADKELQPLQGVAAAEKILVAVLRFHAANRNRPLGQANPWKDVETQLGDKLLEVRRQHLQLVASVARQPEDWARALAMADALVAAYPASKAARDEAAAVWARRADERLKAGDYPAAQAAVEQVEREVLHQAQAGAVAEALGKRAEALLKEARALPDQAAALAKLDEATGMWPRWPGLRDELLKRQNTYRILNVGVRNLPEQLSPATAWTDAEKWAVELLFERLLHEEYDETRGEHYRPVLTTEQPEITPVGRRCRLDPEARWSDGRRVTSTDVRHTVHLLNNPDLPGRTAQWQDRIEPPSVESDPFRIDFHYRRLGLDPLSALTLHVLPQTFNGQALAMADSAEFARAPVGSGPYVYAGRKSVDGRPYAAFVANSYYYRSGRPGQPRIREVRFFVWTDPVADLHHPTSPLHLLLDLSAEAAARLRRSGVRDVQTLENRRIYFLAVNHQVAVLRDHRSLRLALAQGIDRERILTAWFRGRHPAYRSLGALGVAAAAVSPGDSLPPCHRGLNGPFPPHCWACAPASRVRPDLFDAEGARYQLRMLKDKDKVAQVELSLKYPNGDWRVEGACREMATQLAAIGEGAGCPLRIKFIGLAPHALRKALEQRDYELVYHHLDYGSESYWLLPLFDPRPGALRAGGSNYLGYGNDAALGNLFRTTVNHRDFARVKEITHDIHAHLHDRMPLVPLWQLDTQLAIHPSLRPVGLDPLLIFPRVAEWELQP